MCKSDPPKADPIPKAPDKASYQAQAQKRDIKKYSNAKGRNSTILTDPLGIQENATVKKKTLLGA
jgi:hypothetical protein